MTANIEKLNSQKYNSEVFEYFLKNCKTPDKDFALRKIISIKINQNVLYLPANTLNIFSGLKTIHDFFDNNFSLSPKYKICLNLFENTIFEMYYSGKVLSIADIAGKVLNINIENPETLKLNLLTFINYNLINNYLYQNMTKTISIKKLIKTIASCLNLIYKQPIELNILDTEKQISGKETIDKIMLYFRLTLAQSDTYRKIVINGYRENDYYILEYVKESKPFLSIRF